MEVFLNYHTRKGVIFMSNWGLSYEAQFGVEKIHLPSTS